MSYLQALQVAVAAASRQYGGTNNMVCHCHQVDAQVLQSSLAMCGDEYMASMQAGAAPCHTTGRSP